MLTDSQLNAIEKRVLETPEGQPLPEFGRAPVLALIKDLRDLRRGVRDLLHVVEPAIGIARLRTEDANLKALADKTVPALEAVTALFWERR